jgi:hypothetical protein
MTAKNAASSVFCRAVDQSKVKSVLLMSMLLVVSAYDYSSAVLETDPPRECGRVTLLQDDLAEVKRKFGKDPDEIKRYAEEEYPDRGTVEYTWHLKDQVELEVAMHWVGAEESKAYSINLKAPASNATTCVFRLGSTLNSIRQITKNRLRVTSTRPNGDPSGIEIEWNDGTTLRATLDNNNRAREFHLLAPIE